MSSAVSGSLSDWMGRGLEDGENLDTVILDSCHELAQYLESRAPSGQDNATQTTARSLFNSPKERDGGLGKNKGFRCLPGQVPVNKNFLALM